MKDCILDKSHVFKPRPNYRKKIIIKRLKSKERLFVTSKTQVKFVLHADNYQDHLFLYKENAAYRCIRRIENHAVCSTKNFQVSST